MGNALAFDVSIILKTVLAAFLGALIGFERKKKGYGIGSRTASLLSMSAAIFTITGLSGGHATNIARVVQGLAIGVGFIGGAIIWREPKKDGEFIIGLTTAATIWFLTALGIFVGAGFYVESFIITAIALGILYLKKIGIE